MKSTEMSDRNIEQECLRVNNMNMYVKTAVSVLAFCVCSSTCAQLTVEECYAGAKANYPLVKQYGLIERARDYNLSNAGKACLPQVQLSAKASWQSEVTEIPVDFSKSGMAGVSIPRLNRDQYGAAVDVVQTVWDGGLTGARRKTVRAKSEAEEKELDVSMYAVKERINRLFFGILLCDALIEQNRLFRDELQRNYGRIEACIRSGIASRADLDAVRVEQLKAEQALTQTVYTRKAYLEMMSAFVGRKLDENVSLQKPETALPASMEIRRPELALFDSRNRTLDAAGNEVKAGLMPKFSLFLTGGYGNPGLNMLKNRFAAYYIGGVRMTWNFGNFYTKKNTLNAIEVSRNTVAAQREAFLFNTSLDRTGRENEAGKYYELLRSDDEIIALRNSVKRAAEARLAAGTVNATDLMREVTAEQMAKQDKIVHEIELLQTLYDLRFTLDLRF